MIDCSTCCIGYYTVGGYSITTRSAQKIVEPGFYSALGVKWPCRAGTFGASPGLTVDGLYKYYNASPTSIPTSDPSVAPSAPDDTDRPTLSPSHPFSSSPSSIPTIHRSVTPTVMTSTVVPTIVLSRSPTSSPSLVPSSLPSLSRTSSPSGPSLKPTATSLLTSSPTYHPTVGNTQPTSTPTAKVLETYAPTYSPTLESELPSYNYICTGVCAPGYFCPQNTTQQVPCPAGTFGRSEGLMTPQCSGTCPLGHYCPNATVEPIPCPQGYFGNNTGLIDETCSSDCWLGGCNPTQQLCYEGYYCPPGSIAGNQYACGDPSYYCPIGSANPLLVSPGYYTFGRGSGGGISDASGSSSSGGFTQVGQRICEEGFFCSGGIKSECLPGYYGDSKGLQTGACSGLCPMGYYCPAGSFNATTHRCPSGRYGATEGLSDSSCSGPCLPGYHCYEGSTSPTQLECAVLQIEGLVYPNLGIKKKSFITVGSVLADVTVMRTDVYLDTFNVSVQVLPNTNISKQVVSEPNSVYCPVGTSIPLAVRSGYYSAGNNRTTRHLQEPCPMGSYCMNG